MYKEFSLASRVLVRQQEINLDYVHDLLYFKLTHVRDRRLHQSAAHCFGSARVASAGVRSRVAEIMGRKKTTFHAFRLCYAQGYSSCIAVGSIR